jgi:hypothetical protein
MTLLRFLILFAIGVALALVAQWIWLYWVLAVAALLVVIQLVRK